MPELTIELNLPPGKLLAYYRRETNSAQARAVTGETVQFPASALTRHVTSDGVQGVFRLVFDENHKFVRLDRVG